MGGAVERAMLEVPGRATHEVQLLPTVVRQSPRNMSGAAGRVRGQEQGDGCVGGRRRSTC